MKTLLLIDGNNVAHRAFNTIPKHFGVEGEKTGCTFGFMRMIHSLMKKFATRQVMVCFDGPGASTGRKLISPAYKSDRDSNFPEADSFYAQMERIKEILKTAKCTVVDSIGGEADDYLYWLAMDNAPDFDQVIIVSTDHDLLQAMEYDNVKVLRNPPKGTEKLWTRADAQKEMGFNPEVFRYYWAMVGDPGDCVKPVFSKIEAAAIMQYPVTGLISFKNALHQHNITPEKYATILQNLELVSPHDVNIFEISPKEIHLELVQPIYERLKIASLIKDLPNVSG